MEVLPVPIKQQRDQANERWPCCNWDSSQARQAAEGRNKRTRRGGDRLDFFKHGLNTVYIRNFMGEWPSDVRLLAPNINFGFEAKAFCLFLFVFSSICYIYFFFLYWAGQRIQRDKLRPLLPSLPTESDVKSKRRYNKALRSSSQAEDFG